MFEYFDEKSHDYNACFSLIINVIQCFVVATRYEQRGTRTATTHSPIQRIRTVQCLDTAIVLQITSKPRSQKGIRGRKKKKLLLHEN